MMKRALTLALFVVVFALSLPAMAGHGMTVKKAVDFNPDPHIFETYITAAEHELELPGGEVVTVFAYNGQIPGPEIRVARGDRVIVHFRNELPEDFPSTIHFHGIEVNNSSDGTLMTQAAVESGEAFTYDFIVPRAGVFWYHPHVRGSQVVSAGLYAPLIVTQPEERELMREGALPLRDLSVVLSDISTVDGVLKDIEAAPMLETMNGTEGNHLLVNGKVQPTLRALSDRGVRLRLINASISRYFRLALPDHDIYRVGGEGGLIPQVRVEGGPLMGMRMKMSDDYEGPVGMVPIEQGYHKGELVLGPAQRADVVIVPRGHHRETLTVKWKDFARGRHQMMMTPMGMMMTEAEDDGLRPSIDLFDIQIYRSPWWLRDFDIAEGDALVSPPEMLEAERTDTQIKLQSNMMAMMNGMPKNTWFQIDGVSGVEGRANYRTASIGETIEWETHNHTDMDHPFHLHGFSFQPQMFQRMNHEEGYMDMWSPNLNGEFVDTVNIPPHTSVFYSFQVDERPEYGDEVGTNSGTGALGDWVFHCHIFQHGENGMMSFLRVE